MTDDKVSKRDVWSKIEIFSKIIGDVILVFLTLVIGYSANKISTAIQSGELTQKLLSDLAASDSTSRLKHEIALAALNKAVWDQNPGLVWEVCERIVTNSDYRSADRTYAYNILKQRDSVSAKKFVLSLIPHTIVSVDSSIIVSKKDTMLALSSNDAVINSILDEFHNLIFIQFKGSVKRELIQDLQNYLNSAGYNAPGIERIDGKYQSEIRFFYKHDEEFARQVGQLVEEFLYDKNINIDFRYVDLSASKFKVPERQIEIWLSINH